MTVDNSKWYVRVAPDEVYSEPCAHKAIFHLTFARINQGSKEWQGKLVPVQQEMEAAVAAHAGAPYKARKVTFHLPDFIDIVINAGDDREPARRDHRREPAELGPGRERGQRPHRRDGQPLHRPRQPLGAPRASRERARRDEHELVHRQRRTRSS